MRAYERHRSGKRLTIVALAGKLKLRLPDFIGVGPGDVTILYFCRRKSRIPRTAQGQIWRVPGRFRRGIRCNGRSDLVGGSFGIDGSWRDDAVAWRQRGIGRHTCRIRPSR